MQSRDSWSVIPPSPFVPRILLSKMRGVLQGEGCFSAYAGIQSGFDAWTPACAGVTRKASSRWVSSFPRMRESSPDREHVPLGV